MQVLQELGRGADSVVYRARRLGGEYALKTLRESPADDEVGHALAAFRREAALMVSIDHPGLPRVHDVGLRDGRPYLVMDLVGGNPLAELLRAGPMPVRDALQVALDVVRALVAVHRRGLVHRDVKPQNIMMVDGRARLIDFGLAARRAGRDPSSAGTPGYAAPELTGMVKRPVDGRADLYSTGVILYECLTGLPPFAADDPGELLRLHATATPPDPRSIVAEVPATVAAVVAVLLAKDPDDRYPSGRDLATDLQRLIDEPAAEFAAGRRTLAAGWLDEHPLIGRDDELAQVTGRWARARAGAGGICLIRAPSGLGKSRLAAEVVAAARDDHTLVLAGKCAADDVTPLAPLRQAVDDLLLWLARLPAGERARWQERLREAAGAAAPLIGMLAPGLREFLSSPPLPDRERSEQVTAAVVDFLVRLAHSGGGLLLYLDDVQWLDAGTRRILAMLAGAVDDAPLLVLCTSRDDDATATGTTTAATGTTTAATPTAGGTRTTAVGVRTATSQLLAVMRERRDLDIVLGPLGERDVTALVAHHLPGVDLDSTLGRLLTVRGNGNPFVVGEYLNALVDSGLLYPSWDGWVLDHDGLDALELPDDALGLVIARVRALGEDSRRTLVAAATIGSRFHPRLLAVVCGSGLDAVLAVVADAARHRLIEARHGGRYAFLHDRIREALLEQLGPAEAAALHRRIADALAGSTPGVIAEGLDGDDVYAVAGHYLVADPLGAEDRIVAACVAAGRRALHEHAPATAVRFLEYAAGIDPSPDAELLRLSGVALYRARRYTEARARLERALAAQTTSTGRAEVLLELGGVFRGLKDTVAALATARRGLAEVGFAVPRHPVAATAQAVANVAAGLLAATAGAHRSAPTEQDAKRFELISGLETIAAYSGTEGMRPGVLLLHTARSAHLWRRFRGTRTYADGMAGTGFTAGLFGLQGAARFFFTEAETTAVRLGDPAALAVAHWFRGALAFMSGADGGAAWARAVEEHGRWLEPSLRDDAHASLAWHAIVTGRTRQAAAWYRRGTAQEGDREEETGSLATIGAVLAAATGRPAEAGRQLRRIRPILVAHGSRFVLVNLMLAELFACVEQEEFGEPFERVCAEFLSLGISPALTLLAHRPFWFYHAIGRVARYQRATASADARSTGAETERATASDVKAARAAARAALRRLRRVASTSFLRAGLRLVTAQLHLADGRPERCLRTLAAMPALDPDAPILAYETARTRARAQRRLGHDPEALRQAGHARAVAIEEGWPHRERWITVEFGLAGARWGSSRELRPGSAVGSWTESERLRALAAVSRAAVRVTDPTELARIALDETVRLLTAERAFLFLAGEPPGEDDWLVPRIARNATGHEITRAAGFATTLVSRVAATGEPIVVTGTEEGEALGTHSAVLHGLRSILVAPLQLENRVLGVVYLDSQVAKGVFTAEDADLLMAITDHIATSLETARASQLEASVQAARHQRDLAEMLHGALARMSSRLDPEDVLTCLLEKAARLRDDQHGYLLTGSGSGAVGRLLRAGDERTSTIDRPDEAVSRHLSALSGPVVGSGSDLPAPLVDLLGPVGSWLALPLTAHDTAVGVLLLASPAPDAHGEAEVNVAATLVAAGMSAYNNATLFAQVQALAVTDHLTRLPNRRHLFETAQRQLDAARGRDRPIVAVMVDVDHFKQINDTYGHATGDDVLRGVADRLAAGVRSTDVLGRYGGEEFALLLIDTDLDVGQRMAERLRSAVAETPVQTRSGPVAITVSAGVTALSPTDAGLDALLARADHGLYRAKQDGRNLVRAA